MGKTYAAYYFWGIDAVKNNIRNLLSTHKGERYLQPNIGLDLRNYMFEQFTPDLRDRFVIGAGNNYAVAATGGSKDAVVVAHDHDVKVGTAGGSGGGFVSDRESEAVGGGTDTASIQSTGVSGTDKNLPPYYALCYIMKT